MTAAVPVLVYYGVSFIRGKVVALIQSIDNNLVQSTLTNASDIVFKAVLTVSQTFVDALKQHGAFTKEAQDEAYDRAKTYVLKLLNTDAVELLGELYGDMDVWLETMIESAVNSLKTAGQEYAVDIQVDGD